MLAWAVLCALAVGPFWLAERKPPPGRRFAGAFFFQDDYHQHLSFAEQATRGGLLFYNKFDLRPHEPFLLNLTWWAGGLLGRLAAGDPVPGLQSLHLLALGGLVAAAARVLRLGGVSGARLGWALLLFFAGGGLGWLRVRSGRPLWQIPDLGTSLYPWMQAAASGPHGVIGTALVVAALTFLVEWRAGGAPKWRWLATGALLGLTRPFELVLFLLIVLLLAMADGARGRRGAATGPLECLWLLPVLFYDLLVFRFHPSFQLWTSEQNRVLRPPVAELWWALAPGVVLVAVGLARGPLAAQARDLTLALGMAAAAILILLSVPWFPFALQFANTLGPILLLLVAIVTAPSWLPAAALALSPTSLLILWRLFHPPAVWFPPSDWVRAAETLRTTCRPREVMLAPEEPSLVIAGRTPCSVVIGHRVLTPDLAARSAQVRTFYHPATSPTWRWRYLREVGARYVLLSRGGRAWLGDEAVVVPRFLGSSLEVWELPAGGRL